MTLKHILLSLPLIASLAACDQVDEQDRLILGDAVVPARTVLIEDFTGQGCRNCPEAHGIIHALTEQYGDNVIPVSIHAGGFGYAVENTSFDDNYICLMAPEGDAYDQKYNSLQTWPAGVVNRGATLNASDWAQAVKDALAQESPLAIDVTASLDGNTIKIDTELRPNSDLSGKLQLWIIEDGIVARQRDGAKWIQDYEHNHVFRAAVNGTWGEDVTLKAGVHEQFSHSIAVRDNEHEKWVAANLSVVVFVYNDNGVQQAASKPLNI